MGGIGVGSFERSGVYSVLWLWPVLSSESTVNHVVYHSSVLVLVCLRLRFDIEPQESTLDES